MNDEISDFTVVWISCICQYLNLHSITVGVNGILSYKCHHFKSILL